MSQLSGPYEKEYDAAISAIAPIATTGGGCSS